MVHAIVSDRNLVTSAITAKYQRRRTNGSNVTSKYFAITTTGPNVSNVIDCSINIIFMYNDFVFSFHILPSEIASLILLNCQQFASCRPILQVSTENIFLRF